MTIRILLADDHPIVRQGLAGILNNQSDMTVVAEADDGRAAIEQFRNCQPDIAILDLRMPDVGGVEAIAGIRAEFPDARIIMFTIYDTDEDIYRGLRAGAKSYLLKDTPCREILEVIRTVHAGKRYISHELGAKLATRIDLPELTTRELEVLRLLSRGKSNPDISALLSITEGTVKFHVNNILSKLGVSDRTQAVLKALKRGLVQLD
ncbi:response regulator transcription factor [Leptolyngbya sp. FACHB-36]|uniref:response regulator n=1 Tax=Leptolyngbya sp. FACHB-36 TaxID=2692808 RepID=UPI00167FF649|nr:response regulator transcription factor [Leptolyngbya sp. FACHB-36]MBD2020725.1 response regulator transcription factor [Leptolyngbya sp. FACHB-36]